MLHDIRKPKLRLILLILKGVERLIEIYLTPKENVKRGLSRWVNYYVLTALTVFKYPNFNKAPLKHLTLAQIINTDWLFSQYLLINKFTRLIPPCGNVTETAADFSLREVRKKFSGHVWTSRKEEQLLTLKKILLLCITFIIYYTILTTHVCAPFHHYLKCRSLFLLYEAQWCMAIFPSELEPTNWRKLDLLNISLHHKTLL